MTRLDRLIANLGYGTRAEVAKIIAAGAVTINNTTVFDRSMSVDASLVMIEGAALDHPGRLLVMLNKPIGYVCSHDDSEGARAYDLLPDRWMRRNPRVESVGRLDKDSSGLLLLTDDHSLLHRLTSPKHHVPKRYTLTLDVPADESIVARFASGALLIDGDSKPCLPAPLTLGVGAAAEVVLTEGRYRQVRRMFSACGRAVVTLHRTHVGDHALGELQPGEFRVIEDLDSSVK